MGQKNYNMKKAIVSESADYLKNKFGLKLKTVAVTRSAHAHDFEKKKPQQWRHIRHREKG